MSDSQQFPVAAHALAYMAHKNADAPERAVSSALLAASMPTNPVVVRRVTAQLARAGLIATRPGAGGGAWLLRPASEITLDQVLKAVDGCAHLVGLVEIVGRDLLVGRKHRAAARVNLDLERVAA